MIVDINEWSWLKSRDRFFAVWEIEQKRPRAHWESFKQTWSDSGARTARFLL